MLQPLVRRLLIVSAMSLAAFGVVALAVAKIPAVPEFDETLAHRLNHHAKGSENTVSFFRWVTSLGTTPFLGYLSLAVIFTLLLRRQWQLASAWVMSLLLVALFIERTKLAFGRNRPGFNGEFVREDSLSFPSGHAIASMVVFGLLAYLFTMIATERRLRRWAILVCSVIIALIGFSRLYLGVHYLSDVIGGYLLGAAWLAFSIALIEDVRQHYRIVRASSGQ